MSKLIFKNLALKNYRLKVSANIPSGETGTFMSSPEHRIADAVSNVTVYSIMNAKREIDIANAYFISTPGLKKRLSKCNPQRSKGKNLF